MDTNSISVWFSHVDQLTTEKEKTVVAELTESETKRLRSIKSDKKYREYLTSRALMRHALQQYFHVETRSWRFIERSNQLPLITGLPDNVFYSLSHSKGCIFFAIAHYPIGIDIEFKKKDRDLLNAASLFMTEQEQLRLQQKEADPADYFYRIWCAKEAFFKANPAKQDQMKMTNIDLFSTKEIIDNWSVLENDEGDFKYVIMLNTLNKVKIKYNHMVNREKD